MRSNVLFIAILVFILFLFSACAGAPASAPQTETFEIRIQVQRLETETHLLISSWTSSATRPGKAMDSFFFCGRFFPRMSSLP
jgi:hypothetical protein